MLFRSVLIVLALILLGPTTVNADEVATEQQLQQLKQEMEKLQKWLNQASQEKSELESKLQGTEKSISDNMLKILQLKESLDELKKRIAELNDQQYQLRKQIEKQRDQIATILVASYKQGQQPFIKMLLSQENPSQLNRMLNYSKIIAEQQDELVQDYLAKVDQLQANQLELDVREQQTQEQRQTLVLRNNELRDQNNQRTSLINKLNKELASGSKRMESLRVSQVELEALLDRMTSTLEQLVQTELDIPFAKLKGKLGWPVSARISKRFGQKVGKGDLRWQGVLMDASIGTDVKAVHHGRVVFADWLKRFGMLVILDHGDGYLSLYGRNQALMVELGDWVSAGELIATSGDSGGDEAGLYFEVRRKGEPQNPLSWLARK